MLTLKVLESLVNPQKLYENLGVTVLRTGDLQYLQLSVGIMTGNAVDAECNFRNVQKDLDDF